MPLHPTLKNMLDAAQAARRPGFAAGTPAQAREMVKSMRAALGSGPADVAMQALQVPTRTGPMAAQLYSPAQASAGLVVYLHGGGWVCGALEDYAVLARTLAARSGCQVLLLDYRLAPEHPFPAGLEDVQDALVWASQQLLGGARWRPPLLVAGDSAGANLGLASVLALRGRIAVALQLYFYPVTDSDLERDSYLHYSEGMPLTRQDMQWFFGHYAPPSMWADERISVLRSADLAGSPRTWIATAEYDVLRDEGEAYAQRLRAAGVEVELLRAPGLAHGFARLFNLVDRADDVIQQAAQALASAAKSHAATDHPLILNAEDLP